MAMLNIEYRHSGNVCGGMRRTPEGMERYLESLVKEMNDAGISAKYTESTANLEERNTILINGTDIRKILDGLTIMPLDPDEHCDMHEDPRIIKLEQNSAEWNEDTIEDIPDILVKNAISKVYCVLTNEQY